MRCTIGKIIFVTLFALPTLPALAGESRYDPGSGPAHAAAISHRACDPKLNKVERDSVFMRDDERRKRILKAIGEGRVAADQGNTQACLGHAQAAAGM